MGQKGAHTWTIVVDYHRCPACGYILECRDDFEYRLGVYQKDLICGRCRHHFTVAKKSKPTLGPFIGNPYPKEVDWS